MQKINRVPSTTRLLQQRSPTTAEIFGSTVTTTSGTSYINRYTYQICSIDSTKKVNMRPTTIVVFKDNNINSSYAHKLSMAIQSDNKDEVKKLLTENRNLNEICYAGKPILESAFRHPNKEIIRMLLEKGADINIGYIYDDNIAENFVPTTIFLSALATGNLDMASLLVEYGANVDQPNPIGLTPLIFYATTGNTGLINFLITSGANINLQDKTGKTALTWATYSGQLETVKILLKHGANVNNQDITGKTPLFYAAIKKQDQTEQQEINKRDIALLLLAQGAKSPKICYDQTTNMLDNQEFINCFNENSYTDKNLTLGMVLSELAEEINKKPSIQDLENLACIAINNHIHRVKAVDNQRIINLNNNPNDSVSSLQTDQFYSAINNDVQKSIDKLEIAKSLKTKIKII